MKDSLTVKQDKFTLNLFKCMKQRAAYIDAFNAKYSMATIDSNASRLAKTSKVLARLKELQAKAASDAVMGVLERKERLSEIARARITDHIKVDENGAHIHVTPEDCNNAGIQSIKTRVEYEGTGENKTSHTVTEIKLHDPKPSIDILNKMDGIYLEGPAPVDIDIQNVNINVVSLRGAELTQRIVNGDKPDEPTHD